VIEAFEDKLDLIADDIAARAPTLVVAR